MGMLDTAKKLGLIEDGAIVSLETMLKYIGYYPTVTKGDNRDNAHQGMLTGNSTYIALFHLLENGLLSHLTEGQALSLLEGITKQINHAILTHSHKGSHPGILGNVTTCLPVRQYHCKYSVSFNHLLTRDSGIVIFEMAFEHKGNQMWGVMPDGSLAKQGQYRPVE